MRGSLPSLPTKLTMTSSKLKQRLLYFEVIHRSCSLSCHDHNVQTTIEHRFL